MVAEKILLGALGTITSLGMPSDKSTTVDVLNQYTEELTVPVPPSILLSDIWTYSEINNTIAQNSDNSFDDDYPDFDPIEIPVVGKIRLKLGKPHRKEFF